MANWRAVVIPGALVSGVALAAWFANLSGGPRGETVASRNIDFYVMVDTSPSMSIPATSHGITSLEAATQLNESLHPATEFSEKGCAFACHQRNPGPLGTFLAAGGGQISCATSGTYADGTTFNADSKFPYAGRDNFDLSRCLGLRLRIDLVRDAVQRLVETAAQTEKTNRATYRMALFETDRNQMSPAYELKIDAMESGSGTEDRSIGEAAKELSIYTLQPMTSDLSTGGSAYNSAGTITALEVYDNERQLSGERNYDMDTNLDANISSMNGLMPAPGNGANINPRDTPQEVLFIVTDALNDEPPLRSYGPMDWSGVNCRAIKKRGVRIAVLYTTYERKLFTTYQPNDERFYLEELVPNLPKGPPPGVPPSSPVGADPMALSAQQCASPGLYEQVNTDGDISAAMRALFGRVVETANLAE